MGFTNVYRVYKDGQDVQEYNLWGLQMYTGCTRMDRMYKSIIYGVHKCIQGVQKYNG